jgi:hypothetical protein
VGRWRCSILAVTFFLTGCFVSDEPMIGPRDYAYPFPNQAKGDAYTFDGKTGQWTYDHDFSLRRAGAEYVLSENDDTTPFVLMPIGRNEWLAQNGTSDGRYQYGLLRLGDNGAYYVYDLSDLCNALNGDDDRTYQVEKSEDDCVAHSQAGLIAAIRNKMPSTTAASTSYIIR